MLRKAPVVKEWNCAPEWSAFRLDKEQDPPAPRLIRTGYLKEKDQAKAKHDD